MNEAVTVETEGEASFDVWPIGGEVRIDSFEKHGTVRGVAQVILTPGEAVQLSRALVAAAAEALGVSV